MSKINKTNMKNPQIHSWVSGEREVSSDKLMQIECENWTVPLADKLE